MFLSVLTPAIAAAPSSAGTLTLAVQEADGALLGPDSVRIELVQDERIEAARVHGKVFVFPDLAPGAWTARVVAVGYAPVEIEVQVEPGRTVARTITLVEEDLETVVVLAPSEADALRRSAEAVRVVETEAAREQSADLGEVLARTPGVAVRRAGGLGSDQRFSLAGLTDDQVRFFLDGVPLAAAGFPFGIANVPVDLVERVEIYRGVVPVRFGADALGGAVNLVASGDRDGGSVGYQLGSFGVHRAAAHASVTPGPFRIAGAAWLDHATNRYPVEVEVADATGALEPATVKRFHDAYTAAGASLEVGVVDLPWAERLTLRGFGGGFRREIQNNVVMTVPYGEPVATVGLGGGTLRYAVRPSRMLQIEAFASGSHTRRAFVDLGTCVIDWYGACGRERPEPGEIVPGGVDQVQQDTAIDGRARVRLQPVEAHRIELAVSPSGFTRTGEDRLHDGNGPDALTARRDLFQLVTGLEHAGFWLGSDLETRVFVKHYAQWQRSEEPLLQGGVDVVDRSTQRFGGGASLRFAPVDWGRIKASYEYATRLPTALELFGDGVLVLDNLALTPEASHNANLELALSTEGSWGSIGADAGGFVRQAEDLIVLLGNERSYTHFNVLGARSLGVEGSLAVYGPDRIVGLAANATWLDFRNTRDEGPFGDFAGDRIPHRPWLMANGSVHLRLPDLIDRTVFKLDWTSRYVHGFFRSWESLGDVQFKQRVPAQLAHGVALTGVWERRPRISASVELSNLSNARLYDFFGVQRPGRAIHGKVVLGW